MLAELIGGGSGENDFGGLFACDFSTAEPRPAAEILGPDARLGSEGEMGKATADHTNDKNFRGHLAADWVGPHATFVSDFVDAHGDFLLLQ